MGRNNNIQVPKPWEIKCCALAVDIKKVYDKVPAKDGDWEEQKEKFESEITPEEKDLMLKPDTIAKKYTGYCGMSVSYPYLLCLFNYENQKEAAECLKELNANNFDFRPVKTPCFIDKRYMEHPEYTSVVVTLPPPYIEERIRKIIDRYCFDAKVGQDAKANLMFFEGNLGGGRTVMFACGGGDKFLSGGLDHGKGFVTNEPQKHSEEVLNGIEQAVKEWWDNHEGCRKEIDA